MFGLGIQELLLILVVALLFIGPKKLPDIARALGRAMREFRSATDDLKRNFDMDPIDIDPMPKQKAPRLTPAEEARKRAANSDTEKPENETPKESGPDGG